MSLREKSMRRFALGVLLACAAMGSGGIAIVPARAQSGAAQAPERKTSNPYKGDLSIFDYPDRDKKLQVERVMDVLGIKPGSAVADIGAGSGWFTMFAAKRAGSEGKVYAVDINPAAAEYIEKRAKGEGLANVKTIVSDEDDPKLPEQSVDAVLLLKTYHEVSRPVALLTNLRRALRPGARVGIIDKNGNGANHGVARKVVIEEAGRAGYELAEEFDFVKGDGEDYFLVFRVK